MNQEIPIKDILQSLDLIGKQQGAGSGERLESISPITGEVLASVPCATAADYERIVIGAIKAFQMWQMTPAPKRGDIVRQIGNAFRNHKKEIGSLITAEMGKIRVEGEGEVQELIDITDFAVGQSRMLYGLTMHSERREHRMYEQWHPLGPIGVITSFNFPIAVWAWNAMIALIAGDTVIWKPSSKTPLTAIAAMKLVWQVMKENGLPDGILNLIIGNRNQVGETMINDRRIPLISATGSTAMGLDVSRTVSGRLGKTILELGGNNAAIVTAHADLNLAIRAILFGAIGTAGQRCTTTRRIIVHKDIHATVTSALIEAYKQIRIGNPLEKGILMGPLIDKHAVTVMQDAIETIKRQGGEIVYGGEILSGDAYRSGTYVTPCICNVKSSFPIVRKEIFAPILYVIAYEKLEDAMRYHNEVPQGLSSSIFTNDLTEAEIFLSHRGSDCGIANVNVGTSGAEIGGAFGGEKETGGGREAGSDVWKAYMRRQTCTINWSGSLPLAQGIRFEI